MKYPRIVEGLLVKHTGPKGYGLFTMRSYKKDEPVLVAHGVKIKDTDPRLSHRGVQIAPHTFIEPARFSGVWYMNHSCNPNAYVEHDTVHACRALKKGEEIVADYSLFTDFPSWDMTCHCGEKGCRKVIASYRTLKPRPTKFVSGYLMK